MTTQEKYKLIKSRLGINDAQVAEWFGYKNPMSFANSSGKEAVQKGIVSLFECIGGAQIGFFGFNDLED